MRVGRFGTHFALASIAMLATHSTTFGIDRLPDRDRLATVGLTLAWHQQINILGLEKVRNLTVYEGQRVVRDDPAAELENEKSEFKRVRDAMVFVGTNNGNLHCLDADTGAPRWSYSLGGGTEVFPPAITENYIYVAAGARLVRLERSSGRPLYERELPGVTTAGVAANDHFLYVPVGNTLICYELPDPKLENKPWERPEKMFQPDTLNGGKMFVGKLPPGRTRSFEPLPEKWRISTFNSLTNPPVVHNKSVVAVDSEGKMAAFRQENGYRNYVYSAGFPVVADLSSLERFLFLGTHDFAVYCINIENGDEVWRHSVGFRIRSKPIPFSNEVLVVSYGDTLTSIDFVTGEPNWTLEGVRDFITATKNHIYASNRLNEMLVINRETGGVIAKLPSNNLKISADNQVNDRLYLASEEGLVVCLHEKSSPTPYLHPQITGIEEAGPVDKPLATKAGVKDMPMEEAKPKLVPRSSLKKPDGGKGGGKGKTKGKDDEEGDLDEGDRPAKGKGKAKGGRKKKSSDDADL